MSALRPITLRQYFPHLTASDTNDEITRSIVGFSVWVIGQRAHFTQDLESQISAVPVCKDSVAESRKKSFH